MNIDKTNSGNSIVTGLNSISPFQKEKGRNKMNAIPVVSNLPQLFPCHRKLEADNLNETNNKHNLEEGFEFIFHPSLEDINITGYYSRFRFYNWLKVIDSVTEGDFKKGLFVNIIV